MSAEYVMPRARITSRMIRVNLLPQKIKRLRANANRWQLANGKRRYAARTPEKIVADQEYARERHARNPALNIRRVWLHKLRTFGIDEDEYERRRREQSDRCACCGTHEPGAGKTHWLVDHDHMSGAIRGLLCHRCNAGIGMLGDTVEHVEMALAYLRRVSPMDHALAILRGRK